MKHHSLNDNILQRYSQGQLTDAHAYFGCHYLPDRDAYRFLVWAPEALNVAVVGDFNHWNAAANPMERWGGAWVAVIRDVHPGDIYKYAVTGHRGETVWKADPYAFHSEIGPHTGSKVWELDGFEWHDAAFMASRGRRDVLNAPMSVYELHLGSWKKGEEETYPWYRSVADALADYCRDMGYTHVELLPVTEYPYDGSWGYQVTGYFAPTSRYGTPQDFMYLVDTLHAADIGVIMDWVPAHFPRDAHGLARFDGTALYERSDPKMAAHPDWGTLIFDYEKGAVQSFLLSSLDLFAQRYHIDGVRVDAVTSMLYLSFGRGDDYVRNRDGGDLDLGAVALLQRMNTTLRDRGMISVAEESTAHPGVTEAVEKGGLGFTFKWDMGYMHDTLDYFELDPLFRRGSHNKLTFSMMYTFSEHFVLAYSHDEVVHGKKSMLNKMSGEYDQKFSTLRALYGYQYAHPGKKLNFMGSEFGQFIEWDEKRELDWFLLKYPRHGEMQRYVKALNHFYTQHPSFYEKDCGWDGFRWLNVNDADRSCLAFLRRGEEEQIVCLFNFTPKVWELQIGLPVKGRMKLLLSSDDPLYGGTGHPVKKSVASRKVPFWEFDHSALMTLPPLSASYYLFREDQKK